MYETPSHPPPPPPQSVPHASPKVKLDYASSFTNEHFTKISS